MTDSNDHDRRKTVVLPTPTAELSARLSLDELKEAAAPEPCQECGNQEEVDEDEVEAKADDFVEAMRALPPSDFRTQLRQELYRFMHSPTAPVRVTPILGLALNLIDTPRFLVVPAGIINADDRDELNRLSGIVQDNYALMERANKAEAALADREDRLKEARRVREVAFDNLGRERARANKAEAKLAQEKARADEAEAQALALGHDLAAQALQHEVLQGRFDAAQRCCDATHRNCGGKDAFIRQAQYTLRSALGKFKGTCMDGAQRHAVELLEALLKDCAKAIEGPADPDPEEDSIRNTTTEALLDARELVDNFLNNSQAARGYRSLPRQVLVNRIACALDAWRHKR